MSRHKKRRGDSVLSQTRRRDQLARLDESDSIYVVSKGELPNWLRKVSNDKLPKQLAWLDLDSLPVLYSARGERLAPQATVGFIKILKRPDRDGKRLLEEAEDYIHPTAAARLVEALVERYVLDHEQMIHTWIPRAHRIFFDRYSTEHLIELLLRATPHEEVCKAVLSTFREDLEIGAPILRALCHDARVAQSAVQMLSGAQAISKRRKWHYYYFEDIDVRSMTFEEQEDVMLALGFDESGYRPFEVEGEVRWVSLDWLEAADLDAMVARLWSDAHVAHPDEAEEEEEGERSEPAGVRSLRAVASILSILLEEGARLLEAQLTEQVRWSRSVWNELFIEPLFMKIWSRRLVWGVFEGRHLVSTFRVCEDLTLADLADEEFAIPQGKQIGLVSADALDAATRDAWADRLASYELISPIRQLDPLPVCD